jgi:dTDP-glucose 4,6-dehydratase
VRYEMVDFHSSRPGHDLRYALDGSKMALMGWVPPQSFEQSLHATVQWTLAHPKWLLDAPMKVAA